ncbi:MAG: hypothetical protein HOP03_10300 [Lysobacter sp.]|nr:hypothetical protein [Lysobacter sp.]
MPHNASIRRFRLSLFGVGLLLATPAFAHETLPRNWCLDPNTVPKVVLNFDFTEADLTSYRNDHPLPGNDTCRADSSCGIVDDWFWANEMSQTFCSASPLRRSLPRASESVPFVGLPATFNSSEHHRLYNFRDGLKGVCVVCIPNEAVPAPESPLPSK